MKPDADPTEMQDNARRFGFVMAGACAVVAGIIWWQTSVIEPVLGFAVLGLLFTGAALAIPRALIPLNRAWLKFGDILHRIVSPLVMAAIFFGVITPIGLLMRLFGKDFLNLRRAPEAPSYWIDQRDPEVPRSSMTQQF